MFDKLVYCVENDLGVSGTRVDEARVVGGACGVESFFVLVYVFLECQGVYCEAGFLGEPLQLALPGF